MRSSDCSLPTFAALVTWTSPPETTPPTFDPKSTNETTSSASSKFTKLRSTRWERRSTSSTDTTLGTYSTRRLLAARRSSSLRSAYLLSLSSGRHFSETRNLAAGSHQHTDQATPILPPPQRQEDLPDSQRVDGRHHRKYKQRP